MKIVECVPNISEGRRAEIYHAVANAAAAAPGVTLLNVDPGADTNRTVITFVGQPDDVLEGAFRLVKKGVLSGLMGLFGHAPVVRPDVVRTTLFRYPEALGLFLAAQLLIGRYTGYRLSELFRFRDFVQGDQPPLAA